MGFFYQAIKRATGQPVEDAAETEATTSSATEPVQLAAAAVASVAGETAAQPFDAISPAKTRSAVARQLLRLQNPIEMLVAFLSPPVIDENIIAMEQCRVVRTRLLEVIRARKV